MYQQLFDELTAPAQAGFGRPKRVFLGKRTARRLTEDQSLT